MLRGINISRPDESFSGTKRSSNEYHPVSRPTIQNDDNYMVIEDNEDSVNEADAKTYANQLVTDNMSQLFETEFPQYFANQINAKIGKAIFMSKNTPRSDLWKLPLKRLLRYAA